MKHKSNGTSCIQPIPKQNYTELPVKKSSLKPTTSIRFPQRKRWPSESCCRSSLPFVLLHFSRYPYQGWFLEIIKIVNKCFKRNLFKLRAQVSACYSHLLCLCMCVKGMFIMEAVKRADLKPSWELCQPQVIQKFPPLIASFPSGNIRQWWCQDIIAECFLFRFFH